MTLPVQSTSTVDVTVLGVPSAAVPVSSMLYTPGVPEFVSNVSVLTDPSGLAVTEPVGVPDTVIVTSELPRNPVPLTPTGSSPLSPTTTVTSGGVGASTVPVNDLDTG